jgi:hypothetical protein
MAKKVGVPGPKLHAFVSSYVVCQKYEPSDFIDAGLETPGGSTEPSIIASTWAINRFPPGLRLAGSKGCLAGFKDLP